MTLAGASPISLLLVLWVLFSVHRIWYYDRVLPGVWIEDVVVAGMDRATLTSRIAELSKQFKKREVAAHLDGLVFRFALGDVDADIDIEACVNAAFHSGRETGLAGQFLWWLKRWGSSVPLGVRIEFDQAKLGSIAEGWERAAITDPPSIGGVHGSGGKLVAESPKPGRVIDRQKLGETLQSFVGAGLRGSLAIPTASVRPALTSAEVKAALEQARRLIRGSVEVVTPDGKLRLHLTERQLIDALESRSSASGQGLELGFSTKWLAEYIEKAGERLARAPKNASFVVTDHNEVRVLPGVPGVRLDPTQVADALWQAVHAPSLVGVLPVDREAEPEFTTAHAHALNIKKLVSRFTTRHKCCQARVQNIHRMADILDGTIVLPGEVFSINEKVGPRTEKNGFVLAPTIIEGDMEDTVGGGVSQFATTFFNAILHGGYDVIERQPHSYWFPRYPMGHEATLSFPKPDIIFKNDTKSGVLIKTEYTDTSITVKLFGDDEGRKVKTSVSGRENIIDPPVELVPDPSLEPDEEKVRNGGSIGWSVITRRVITFADGEKKQEQRRVTYNPRVKIVAVHPCRIPEGEEGYTGQDCPEPEDVELETEEGTEESANAGEGLPEPTVAPVEE